MAVDLLVESVTKPDNETQAMFDERKKSASQSLELPGIDDVVQERWPPPSTWAGK